MISARQYADPLKILFVEVVDYEMNGKNFGYAKAIIVAIVLIVIVYSCASSGSDSELKRSIPSYCNPNYLPKPNGDCIPKFTKSPVYCRDFTARNVKVIGTDVYLLDGDGDGTACERPSR